jgi:Trypsin-like peptidase domain
MQSLRILFCLFFSSAPALSPAQTVSPELDRLSATSLRLTVRHDNVDIGNATGFVLQKGQHYYLITNRHVVLSCAEDKDTNDVGGWLCANVLVILHNRANHLGQWLPVQENLYDEHNSKRWLEHPILGSSADLVALPLSRTEGVGFYPLDLDLEKTEMVLAPGEPVSVVGFPFGMAQAGGLAVWKSGTLASDPDVDVDGKPKFLLDITARASMSGSPVYARPVGMYQAKVNEFRGGSATKFLGVFAEQSLGLEIGAVWKAKVVRSLYESLP